MTTKSINATVGGIKYSHISGCVCFLCKQGNTKWRLHVFEKYYYSSLDHKNDLCLMCNHWSGSHRCDFGKCTEGNNRHETYFSSLMSLKWLQERYGNKA